MTTKKPKKRRSRFQLKRRFHHRDKRISIIGTMGAVGSLFVPQNAGTGGEMALGEWFLEIAKGQRPINADTIQHMLGDAMGQYVGYNPTMNRWGIPMATVTAILSGVTAKVAGKYANKYIKNVPFIGKYVKL